MSNEVIATVAGNGTWGSGGDNGPASDVILDVPVGVSVSSSGDLYIAEFYNNRIRKVSNGVITTVVGNGTAGYGGDDGPAIEAQLYNPESITVDSAGSLYIGDGRNARVRKVSDGVITTVAGNGTAGYSGDDIPAAGAQLNSPTGIAVDSWGDVYIADTLNYRVRRVFNGVIATVAGNGEFNDSGPTSRGRAGLNTPYGVAVDPTGDVYFTDRGNGRIRKISNGVITTVAGSGSPGYSVEYLPPTAEPIGAPAAIALDSSGNLYFT